MKNPFKKNDNSNGLLIAGIIGGAIAAGIITALIINHKRELADAAAEAKEHATDYLKAKSKQLKKHKSDVNDLADIISHS
ncbi:hypothetical protein EOD41_02815 [Mucilaginibacter limnophilus]|uniref:YtxH domain-containing protein n=1 Tax=Mucilaginibacter limnophilus TaxID=1932778 RepID=A0A3S2UNL4_9SPHI|nr:hypothetical protein [Mucilaginibacter limnophilus]RVU02886.1 hypothetical protein EOD41_02815 [Mucilaginibacter limnophilus]